MSKPSWKEQLDQILEKAAARKLQNSLSEAKLRVAVVGIGNELNGDDAAGNQVAAKLMAGSGFPEHFLAINAGSMPENATSRLRKFGPDLVLMVDAADFGGEAGEITCLDAEKIEGFSASSHTLPLPILGSYLEAELNCKIEYIGIQPEQLEFDAGLSAAVKKAVTDLTVYFNQL